MTIEKNTTWASETTWPEHAARIDNDRELALRAAACLAAGAHLEAILEAGDLRTTLGAPRPAGAAPYRYPCDLGFVRLDDGDEQPFAAHVVWRGRLWQGPGLVAMNAAYLGPWNLGPKSHPNDGLLDITFGALGWQQRRLAAARARQGTHLPHPELTMKRTASFDHELGRRRPVRLDGVVVGTAQRLRLRVEPDAFVVVA